MTRDEYPTNFFVIERDDLTRMLRFRFGPANVEVSEKVGMDKDQLASALRKFCDLLSPPAPARSAAPKAVREMVQSGKVSATLAVETLKKEGANAAKVLKAAEVVATTKGKVKVTKKAVKATKPETKPTPAKTKKAAPEAPSERAYPVILTATRLPARTHRHA